MIIVWSVFFYAFTIAQLNWQYWVNVYAVNFVRSEKLNNK